MLKTRVMNLVRRLRGLPCPECGPPKPVEWLEDPADLVGIEPGPAPPCPKCGRLRSPEFVVIVKPEEVPCE